MAYQSYTSINLSYCFHNFYSSELLMLSTQVTLNWNLNYNSF